MGEDTRKKILDISKEQILELYNAGPDAVISFVVHIHNLINGLGEKIEAQQKIIEQQEERIRELKGIIKKNSHTSSKPPSSDGYAKRTITQKKRSDKRPGVLVPKNLAAPIPEILAALKTEVRKEPMDGTGRKNRFNSNE